MGRMGQNGRIGHEWVRMGKNEKLKKWSIILRYFFFLEISAKFQ
jgi:hypothetical protein